jgi:HD-like signal output (HDOD) protein
MSPKFGNPEKRLIVLKTYISRMPSLSTTAMKVAEICNNPHTSPADLNRVISLDPVLTGRVLKLVNSAYYGLATQVTSLTRAIIMVGLNTVVNLAISTAVVEKMEVSNPSGPLSVDDFWTHSLCAGVVAKFLSGLRGIPAAGQEEYFVAGLLHDLGKVALNDCFSEEYGQVFNRVREGLMSLSAAEMEAFGIDHCQVGRMIAEKWQLGASLGDSLAYHHDLKGADGSSRPLVTLVSLGDSYANMLGMGSPGYPKPDESVLSSLLEKAGLRADILSDYEGKVLEEIEKARVFIQLSAKG